MDKEDRLTYIREQKKKLGLDNNVLLKSSRKTTVDS